MNIDIRSHIKENFKDSSKDDIKKSIESSIEEKEEVTLPGLGVFFEIMWQNADDVMKEKILDAIKSSI